MSYGRDLLGQIANARAEMMMRGHWQLRVLVGPGTLDRLRREAWPVAAEEGMILDLPMMEEPEMEGFAVVPVK